MKFDAMQYLTAAGVDEQTAADWLELRRVKKSPPSATAINMLAKQASLAGVTLTQALELCCMNGWQGFKADWVAKSGPAKSQYQINQEATARAFFGKSSGDEPRLIHGEVIV